MRCQEAYQEESTSLENGTLGDIDPGMDLLNMDNDPGSPISRDIVETIRRWQHRAQGEEIDNDDEDETFLEYHSLDEGNMSEDSDDD